MAAFGSSRPLTWIAVALIAAVGYYIVETARHSARMLGLGQVYSNVNTTSCRQIGHGELSGCEDIIVDSETGLAYLACGRLYARQRWAHPDDPYDPVHEEEADRVYVMDESDNYSELKVLERLGDGTLQPFSQDFRVHGFDIYWSPGARQEMTFMFINHQLHRNAISIFSHKHGTDYLVHVETVASDLLNSPNNILALSKRAFYATNDMKYVHGIMREVSKYLRIPNTHVVYRSEQGEFAIAAKGIRYANGIAKHQDWIYVVSSGDPGIHVYKALPDHSLALNGRIGFKDSIPDNIFVDPLTGQLYCASFLKALEALRYFKHPSLNTTVTAGTKILRITPRGDPRNGFDIEPILIDSGRLMPTATIAAVQRRGKVERLLVGGVMSDALVVCDSVL
ncbi:hypothetical protein IW152_001269 [Coemansia sp. BCRC 34962]|nr:hypothetical protein IW152_001269 [Coemansia sp. BCRC 34962]